MGRSYRKPDPLATVSDVNLDQLNEQAPAARSLDVLAREGARLMLEAALREEVDAYLGRAHYERREGEQVGYRNGTRTRKLTSGVGELAVEVPRVRNTAEPFSSEILPARQRILAGVEDLFAPLWVEGLSQRDFERALGPSLGEAGLSKSSVSRVCEEVREGYRAWRQRPLDEEDIAYLFLDGVYLAVRAGSTEKEGVLVAHGVRTNGSRVLLAVELGYRETTMAWQNVLSDLARRGLRQPKLVISDGSPGLLAAVAGTWPEVAVQRCVAHKMRNVLAKVPKQQQPEVRADLSLIFYAESEAQARSLAAGFEQVYGARFPAATRCLMSGLDACLTFYRFPEEHWRRLRTSNILERCFKEVKRRTDVIGRFPQEDSALAMVWAVIDRDALRWRGIQVDGPLLRLLEAAVVELPKSMWAINNTGQERQAA